MEQEEIDKLMEKIDRKCKFPKHWKQFLAEQYKEHNIIIKNVNSKEVFCTNCNKTFNDKSVKVGKLAECPNCNKRFEVCGSNYYRKSFEKSVMFLQRMDKQIIARVFQIFSFFERDKKEISRDFTEYVRIIPTIGTFLGNNSYINTYGVMRIYNENADAWYKYTGCKCFTHFNTYPYNETRLIKGTKFEYAPLKEFREKFYSYNFLDMLNIATHESFELLWKMKLYSLSASASKFNKSGSFYKRFRVPKNYLKFMQENDVDYREMRIIQLLKNLGLKDMEKYIKLYRYNYSEARFLYKQGILKEYTKKFEKIRYVDVRTLKRISEYVPLKKFVKYDKGMEKMNIYLDYLDMAKKLALNYKKKEDLFPENLIERHDELQSKIEVEADMKHCFGIYLRFLELSKYIYEDDKYIIFPANSSEEFVSEGNQQKNCVNYMYSNRYINKETEIYFMRKIEDVRKSLVTIEFKDNRVKQKEQGNHEDTTEEQDEFIEKWIMYRNFVDKREKYRNKTTKVVQYNLEKLVA